MAKQKQDALAALLGADINVETSVPIKRLGVDFIIKAVDGKTMDRLKSQSTFGKELDEHKFGGNIIATACTNPNFGDAKLLEKVGASDAGDCVQKALLAGEIAKITAAIMDISGFGDFDEQVAEAKNL
ncbi:phage tail assembly chaperone [Peribacillus butanolivorans]|uniref:XkdN n=1 Tax=Peribacillus butanolivorans TaxID=421767 RepID=A0ABM6XNA3_9BACI|nr:hypothetical protein [Peribacillus butanolivorans]AXN39854.1 hypothetical protein DTO10_16800 [Peribacillus butanolivorans]